MILVIDTSASTAAVVAVNNRSYELFPSARSQELIPLLRRILRLHTITKVAVATGPGSFTGLRVGVSFAVGLAMGLKIPIVPLPSLALQSARSERPVTAVVEAGRGRFYYQLPGLPPALGEPAEIPRELPLVGRVSPKGRVALESAGHSLEGEGSLRLVSHAARLLLETAPEVPYGSLKLEYMQNFAGKL